MIKVVELYRHPVKSFTAERLDELQVVGGKVRGDRVLGFRFADQGAPDDWSWRRKHNYVVLSNSPGIPRIELEYDDESHVLTLNYRGAFFAEGSVDSEEDRVELSEAVAEFVSSLSVNPLVGHPERLPLNLIGDGRQGLFHDFEEGGVTLHSVESVNALTSHMGIRIDGRRFRTNVVVEGVEAWEELSWTGRISIGGTEYEASKLVPRCLATHANPVNGERDLDVMRALTSANGREVPTFAVLLKPVESKSVIRVGDSVTVG